LEQTAYKKRIVKNTLLLQFRKVIILCISLYTSRLLLQQLGVEGYGLYGLVGSILAIFSSIRGLFATSIQRFINVAKAGAVGDVNKDIQLFRDWKDSNVAGCALFHCGRTRWA